MGNPSDPHPRHAVVTGRRHTGRCTLHAGDWSDNLASICVRADRIDGLYGQPARYISTDTRGYEAGLCLLHAAHVRTCPTCAPWLASLRIFHPAGDE